MIQSEKFNVHKRIKSIKYANPVGKDIKVIFLVIFGTCKW